MKKKQPWWQGPRGEGYVIMQFILIGILFFAPRNLPGAAQWSPAWAAVGVVGGLVLGLVGAGLAIGGLLSLGENLTAVPRPKETGSMVANGAYRLVRHPIYSGIILGAIGWALLQNGLLTLLYAFILFLFFDIKSRQEELWLCEKYNTYPEYQQRVKKLIPFIY